MGHEKKGWKASTLLFNYESYRLKKPVHLLMENTKIEAHATSHLKSDNKGETQ